jgi:2-oxoglutarate ferredoxin oxidoreductase subunit gamma
MATHEIIIAGFGGQGVMFLGEVLAHAAVREDLHVTWLPSYGPEQRGGTANCTVIISDEPIASPVVADPAILIAMNRPSLDRFEPAVRPGGLIITDGTMVERAPARSDVESVAVPATQIARDLGSTRAANVVVLGALLARRPILSEHSIRAALEEKVADPEARARNLAALERGRREALTAHPAEVAR